MVCDDAQCVDTTGDVECGPLPATAACLRYHCKPSTERAQRTSLFQLPSNSETDRWIQCEHRSQQQLLSQSTVKVSTLSFSCLSASQPHSASLTTALSALTILAGGSDHLDFIPAPLLIPVRCLIAYVTVPSARLRTVILSPCD